MQPGIPAFPPFPRRPPPSDLSPEEQAELSRLRGIQDVQRYTQLVFESCLFKSATSAVAGGVLGMFMGLFFGGYSNAVDHAVEMKGSTREKIVVGFKEAGKSMKSYSKNFASWGAVYSGSLCVVEKYRAKHDIWNSIAAGCMTGGVLAAQPKSEMTPGARATQMAVGCAGMAAFSAAIDYYIEFMD